MHFNELEFLTEFQAEITSQSDSLIGKPEDERDWYVSDDYAARRLNSEEHRQEIVD